MSYNILDGALEESRFNKICEIINSENPDIIFLQELNDWDENRSKYFEEKTNTNVFLGIEGKTSLKRCGIAIKNSIKFPFRQIDINDMFLGTEYLYTKPCVVKLNINTDEIYFVSAHFSHFSPTLKYIEAEILSHPKSNNVILGGDFNCIIIDDEQSIENLTSVNKTHIKPFNRNQWQNYLEIFEERNFTIAHDEFFENTVPTKEQTGLVTFPKMRLDHFIYSNFLNNKIENVSVIKNELTDFASDHYPITGYLTT